MRSVKQVIPVVDHAFVSRGASKVAVASGIELQRRGLKVTVISAIGAVDLCMSTEMGPF